jgi:hypothetical protein
MKNRLSKPLSVIAILAPIVYLILAVLNYNTPMGKFTCWAASTFGSEILFYTFYIKGMEED